MAEQAETTDTSVVVDTSTNEEAQDPETELENMDESFEDYQDEDSEETEEQEEPDESEEEASEPDEEEEPEEPKEDVEQKPDPKEKDEAQSEEERKAHNREMAERRLKEKQDREKSVVESQRKYVDEAKDDHERAVRELQVDAYNNKVESNTNKLTNGFERAVKDFPVLRDASPEIQNEVNAALDAFQAMHVTVNEYGHPTEVRADLYKYLQTKADSIEKLTGIGARKQEQGKSKEKSKTFTPPSRAPKEAKKDESLDAFDAEANRY